MEIAALLEEDTHAFLGFSCSAHTAECAESPPFQATPWHDTGSRQWGIL